MFRTLTQLATAVALTAAITIAMPAWADESKALAEAGRDASVALECAYYANEAGLQPEESARLMEYGYRQGQRFFAAMLAGKISHADLPITETTLGLKVSNVEFLLGRLVEKAHRDVSDWLGFLVLSMSPAKDRSQETYRKQRIIRRGLALEEYEYRRCRTLGSTK